MIEPFIVSTAISALVRDVVQESLKGLGKKYSVDVKYVLNEKIEEEFQRCLNVAIKAFLEFVSKHKEVKPTEQEVILAYLKSPDVTEEIWHLLDPGSEFFDRGRLTQLGYEALSSTFDTLVPQMIFDAWEEFLKAFSFASRSTPEFREFLRASYEAGSFKALSNIEDVLEKMTGAINNLQNEGVTTKQAIEQYANELRSYRDWAIDFKIS